jgi:hypothetical protein
VPHPPPTGRHEAVPARPSHAPPRRAARIMPDAPLPTRPALPEPLDVSRMSRAELLHRLLELNETSTFRFTPAWLEKQWTRRLRSLLLASLRSRQEQRP